MGLLGYALAGAAKGAADSATYMLKQQLEEEKLNRIAEYNSGLRMKEMGAQREWAIEDIGRKADAETEALSRNAKPRAEAQLKAEEAVAPGRNALKAQEKLDVEFNPKVLEAERKKKIDDKQSDLDFVTSHLPQLAKNARALAQAGHIVDPSYTAIPNADGTVDMVDSRNPKNIVKLTGADGKPIIRKDPEELKAASTIINTANTNLKIAEAKFKADPMAKGAETEWQEAQVEHRRVTAPALSILYGKAGVDTKTTTKDEIRYDAAGNAYKKGPDGKPVPVNPSGEKPGMINQPTSQDPAAALRKEMVALEYKKNAKTITAEELSRLDTVRSSLGELEQDRQDYR